MKNKRKKKVDVDVFIINRVMGESFEWKQLGLGKKHVEALNEIGHTGKLKNKPMCVQTYFDKKVKDEYSYTVRVWTSNNMEFTDKLLVTRARIK